LAASEVETTVLTKFMINNSYVHCNIIHKYKTIPTGMLPKNGGLNLSSQEGYRFVQISPGNRAGVRA